MNGPRLVIVSRCFWPVIDDSTFRLHAWLKRFKKLGLNVSLLTSLWNQRWPVTCSLDEVSIVRIGPPPLAQRSFRNYIKGVVEHLVLHRTEYDAILFDQTAEEALTCCQTRELSDKTKLFWYDYKELGEGLMGIPATIQDACRQTDRVLVFGASEERVLRSCGIAAEKIDRLGQVGLNHLPRTLGDRSRARSVLRECCGDMFVPVEGQVIVVPTSLQHRPSIEMFLQAVDPLLDRWSGLRVWFLGDGPERGRIYERIRDMDGARQIALPGCFDSVDEIFQVADVCVLTTPGEGLNYFAPLAWQNNVPCILPMTHSSKERVPEAERWGMFNSGNMLQLRELMTHALEKASAAFNRKPTGSPFVGEGAGWSSDYWRQWGRGNEGRSVQSAGSNVIESQERESNWKRWTR